MLYKVYLSISSAISTLWEFRIHWVSSVSYKNSLDSSSMWRNAFLVEQLHRINLWEQNNKSCTIRLYRFVLKKGFIWMNPTPHHTTPHNTTPRLGFPRFAQDFLHQFCIFTFKLSLDWVVPLTVVCRDGCGSSGSSKDQAHRPRHHLSQYWASGYVGPSIPDAFSSGLLPQ